MKRIRIKELLASSPIGQEVMVKGWVRTARDNKNVIFINLNDGSTIHNIQVVAEPEAITKETLALVKTGACLGIVGTIVASGGSGQSIELKLNTLEVYGSADPETYPLQPKEHSLDFLR